MMIDKMTIDAWNNVVKLAPECEDSLHVNQYCDEEWEAVCCVGEDTFRGEKRRDALEALASLYQTIRKWKPFADKMREGASPTRGV